MPHAQKKKFAAVGTGIRIPMYIDPLVRDYPQYAELVGLCDHSQIRARYHRDRLAREYGYPRVPTYGAAEFETMIRETRPDTVIVCTVDATHHEYIIRALELGCDVVTEKPMTIDAPKCAAIFEAVERTGRKVQVAFNYRWAPGPTKIRELIAAGSIGDIKAVNLEYMLNTAHGADYFRRWHANKQNSGGLLVHKSTHHFDLVNWLIDGVPEEVFSYGKLNYYGKDNAVERGEEARTRYERYTDVPEAEQDPFMFSLREGTRKPMYLDAEAESGYIRDRNVFRDGIDIEDTMAVLVKYRGGTVLNYSLVAYSPVEGFRLTFTGNQGRMEYTAAHRTHVPESAGGPAAEPLPERYNEHLRVTPLFQTGYDVEIEKAPGGHGGGDPRLQAQIFDTHPPEEHLGRLAGHQQGAASILIGAAANLSMCNGAPVKITDLFALNPEADRLSQLI